jgi:hypothetical protein
VNGSGPADIAASSASVAPLGPLMLLRVASAIERRPSQNVSMSSPRMRM